MPQKRFDPIGVRTIGGRWEFNPISVVGKAGEALDLTSTIVQLTISLGPGSPILLQKTSPIAAILIPDQFSQPGIFSVALLPVETALFPLPPGRQLYYRIWVEFDADNQDTVAFGYIQVQK